MSVADFIVDPEVFRKAMANLRRVIEETAPPAPCADCATLARLLDGVMADDHASIREAAAWLLAAHRPESDYPE